MIRIPFITIIGCASTETLRMVEVTGQYKVIDGKKTLVAQGRRPADDLRAPLPPGVLFVFVVGLRLRRGRRIYGCRGSDRRPVLTCHDSDTKKGGIDLSPLLEKDNASYGNYTRLWIRLENMAARGEMPPEQEAAGGGREGSDWGGSMNRLCCGTANTHRAHAVAPADAA